jgi:hypothetical protein
LHEGSHDLTMFIKSAEMKVSTFYKTKVLRWLHVYRNNGHWLTLQIPSHTFVVASLTLTSGPQNSLPTSWVAFLTHVHSKHSMTTLWDSAKTWFPKKFDWR